MTKLFDQTGAWTSANAGNHSSPAQAPCGHFATEAKRQTLDSAKLLHGKTSLLMLTMVLFIRPHLSSSTDSLQKGSQFSYHGSQVISSLLPSLPYRHYHLYFNSHCPHQPELARARGFPPELVHEHNLWQSDVGFLMGWIAYLAANQQCQSTGTEGNTKY